MDGNKIYVAGYTRDNVSPFASKFAIARYNGNGSLDTSFGVGGRVITAVGPSEDVILGLALSESKLIAVGSSYDGSRYNFAITIVALRTWFSYV